MTPEQVAELRRKHYNATVVRLRRPNPDLMIVRVKLDQPLQKHRAGQDPSLGLGNWEPRFPGCQEEVLAPGDETKLVRRAYSISCSILDDSGQLLDTDKTDWLEFYIVLVRESDRQKP